MKTNRVVKDIQSGSIRVMIIQKKKKTRKDGWLLYPSIAVIMAAIAVIGFTGTMFTPIGMTIGVICMAWLGFCAVANAKATRWGTERPSFGR